MHQLVLLTALTATSGILGGRHCTTGQCGAVYTTPAVGYMSAATCTTGRCGGTAMAAVPATPQYHYRYAPTAWTQPMGRRRAWYRPARGAYYAASTACAGGTCYRR